MIDNTQTYTTKTVSLELARLLKFPSTEAQTGGAHTIYSLISPTFIPRDFVDAAMDSLGFSKRSIANTKGAEFYQGQFSVVILYSNQNFGTRLEIFSSDHPLLHYLNV